MSNKNGVEKMMEALKNFFKKLFSTPGEHRGHEGGQGAADPDRKSAILQKMRQLSGKLDIEIESSLDKDNFVYGHMISTHKAVIDSIIDSVEQNKIPAEITPDFIEQISKQTSRDISEKIELMGLTEHYKENFNDYHNHDPFLIENARQRAEEFSLSVVKEANLAESSQFINSTLRDVTLEFAENLKKSPLSHLQIIGLAPLDPSPQGPEQPSVQHGHKHEHATNDNGASYP